MCAHKGWLAGVMVIVLVLASFTLAHAQAKPIKIGQLIPMSGESVEIGKYEKQGAEIAIDKINAAGGINGRKLTVVYEDDQGTNSGGVAALQKLLEDKEIPVILGSVRSTQMQAMLPTINEAKLPVAIGGTNYGLTHSGGQWGFRFRTHDGIAAKVIAQFLVEDLKVKKIAIIHSSEAFGNGGRDMLAPAVKALGGEVVLDQGFNNGEKDFTGVIQAINLSGATGLNTYVALGTDLGVLARQIRQLGVNIPWVGSSSINGVDCLNLGGAALNGTYGVGEFHVDASPTSKEFARVYKAKFNQIPDVYAAWPYDAVLVFAEAMKRSPDLKPENVRKAILSIQKFPGAIGEYNFHQNGDGLDHSHIMQNFNGEVKYIKTIHIPLD